MNIVPTASSRVTTDSSKLLTLVAIVVVLAGLYFGRPVLIPLALAFVLAFLLTPLVELLEKLRIGRIPSVFAVLVVALGLISVVGWVVTGQLADVIAQLPSYKTNIHNKIQALHAPGNGTLSRATDTVNDIGKELSAAPDVAANRRSGVAASGGQPIAVRVAEPSHNATEYLKDLLGPLTGILETTAIVVVLSLFMLLKREDLRNRILRLAGTGRLNVVTQALDDAAHRLSRFLLLQFCVNASYGLIFGAGLYLIEIPNPVLWGVLAFLLRFIPYVGTPIAALFPMFLALAVFPGWHAVGLVFLLFLVLELSVANFIEPWLYGTHTGISSLAVLVAAIFWGMLWGPVGLVLSTPMTVCLILLGRYVPQLNFLEILLGDEPVLTPPARLYQRWLALDDDEGTQIGEEYLKENSLESFYDEVLIPALRQAELDRRLNAIEFSNTKFIYQSAREMVAEFSERGTNAVAVVDRVGEFVEPNGEVPRLRIVCIPARSEADEIVAEMAVQLLQRAGHDAYSVPVGAIATTEENLNHQRVDVTCISAMPPFAVSAAKSLCKQVRQQNPAVKIILGLWDFSDGVTKALERIGPGCADTVETSLTQLIVLIGGYSRSKLQPVTDEEVANRS